MGDTYWQAVYRLHPQEVAERMRAAHQTAGGCARKAAELLIMSPRTWYHYLERLQAAGLLDTSLVATGKGRRTDPEGR